MLLTTHGTIEMYAQEFGKMLLDQIDGINPDIIICGNTFGILRSCLSDVKKVSIHAYKDSEKRLFVDFWHPSNRSPRIMNCYTLRELVESALVQTVQDF